MKKILILGISGMLGNTLFRYFFKNATYQVFGTARKVPEKLKNQYENIEKNLILGIDALNHEQLKQCILEVNPDIIINCIGVIKQLSDAENPDIVIPINQELPHYIASIAKEINARMIHVSTDCVFTGKQGNYLETDIPDATDLYGTTKHKGEIHDQKHVVTMRTSIIGHELNSNKSLIDWFLSQENTINAYTKAIFSGFPTVEIARIIEEYVLPNEDLHGLYHVAAQPIDKASLLKIVSEIYQHHLTFIPNDNVVIDRSLNATKFNEKTGYQPDNWRTLIQKMYEFK
jgi:dTDP-4-dehydrorhamnose reductase